MKADYLINNKVSEEDFEKTVYNWLSEGDYTPDDIIENIITQNNIALMPLYYFKVDYSGSCSVSLGYQRQESYQEWDNVNKRYVTQTRWVTDWMPHSQPARGTIFTVVYAGEPLPNEIITFVEKMDWSSKELITIEAGHKYESQVNSLFKIPKNEAWKNRAYGKIFQKAAEITSSQLPSRLQRNLTLDIDFTEKGFFSLVAPYWLFQYEYQEVQYYVIVDGNSPERIDGVRPVDKKRQNNVIRLRWFGWLTGLLATTLALYFFSDESFNDIGVTWKNIGIVFLGIILTAFLVEFEVSTIKNKSKKIRQETLDKRLKKLDKV